MTKERVLLVCSGGGHLKQLFTLAERIGIAPEDQLWLTFRNGLSESLLAEREVIFTPFAAPRDATNILRLRAFAELLLATNRFSKAVSTGSSPAVAVLPVAVKHGIPAHYIESAARADGPSLSGRLIARNGHIPTYTQYPVWQNDRWKYRGSIFDAFRPTDARGRRRIARVVVSVGTQEGYSFHRLYRALAPLLDGCDVLWQTGTEDVSEFGIPGRTMVPHAELAQAIAEADVVIAHAGTGTAITALENGKVPVLVPRLAKFHEHVDDHQVQIARELEGRGLALMRHAEDLTMDDLVHAASLGAAATAPPRFDLVA